MFWSGLELKKHTGCYKPKLLTAHWVCSKSKLNGKVNNLGFLFESALKLTSRLASTLFIVLPHLPRTQTKHSPEKDLGALLRPGSSKEPHTSKLCVRVKCSRANIYLCVRLCSLYLHMYSIYRCISVSVYVCTNLSTFLSIHPSMWYMLKRTHYWAAI